MASFKNLISNTSAQISSGGTITGDLVINGDLQVDGGGSLSFDEIVQGTSTIKVTDTSAFLIEKADGTDVFVVDTTNNTATFAGDVTFGNTAIFSNNKSINFLNTSGSEKAIISFDSSNITKIGDASSSGTLQLNSGNATFAGTISATNLPESKSTGESFAFGTNAGSAFLGDSVNKINVAIGSNAGTAMADYGGNVFIGKDTAKLRTRGDNNVAIGTSAGGIDGDDFGDKNVFIGLDTGKNINSVNADSNVMIGNSAGSAGTVSISNVLIGDRAANTLNDSRDNVAIGTLAGTGDGVTNTTTGNGVYVGYYARSNATNANNEIVIGSSTTGSGSNTVTIGNSSITTNYFRGTLSIFRDDSDNQTVKNNIIVENDGTGDASIKFSLTGATDWYAYVDNSDSDKFKIRRSTTDHLTIDESGNATFNTALMINSSSANYADLTVGGTGDIVALRASSGSAGFTMYEAGTGRFNMTTLNGLNGIAFKTPSTTRMIIDDNSRISLSNNDSGTSNTVFGKLAGDDLASGGNYNSLFGEDAGHAITTGDSNTAVGYQAGLESTVEDFNTYIGYQSGYRTAGLDNQHNTFIGYGSGSGDWTSTKSDKNTGVGSLTLAGAMNSGIQNTALGFGALNIVTTGDSNVGVGVTAGNTLTTGSNNTVIGTDADTSASDSTNQIVIGATATGVANNTAIIGNSSTTDVYMGDNGNVWSQTSDGRLKENVVNWSKGLNEIEKLRIVEFNFKKDNPFNYDDKKKRQGIIAQEAKEIIPEMIKDDGEWLSANTEPMIWTLVKAVQELSAKVKELENK